MDSLRFVRVEYKGKIVSFNNEHNTAGGHTQSELQGGPVPILRASARYPAGLQHDYA